MEGDGFVQLLSMSCNASDGNGTQAMLANLVSEPFSRKVPWHEREDVGPLRQLRRWRF